jgi:peptidoglycan hydrolase CwlO-like protein
MAKKPQAARHATAAQVRALQKQLRQTITLIAATTEQLDSLQREVAANVRRIGELQHQIDILRIRLNNHL